MGSAGTVLLVEDEHSIGSLVRAYLEKERYQVIWVHSGEEALAELTRHPIRIVGWELTELAADRLAHRIRPVKQDIGEEIAPGDLTHERRCPF